MERRDFLLGALPHHPTRLCLQGQVTVDTGKLVDQNCYRLYLFISLLSVVLTAPGGQPYIRYVLVLSIRGELRRQSCSLHI